MMREQNEKIMKEKEISDAELK